MDNTRKKYIFEEMPVLKSIFRCAIPSICSQIILVIYNLADTFFIGLAAKDPFYTSQGLSNALIGGVSICIEECEKGDEFYIIKKPIIVPPMTNGFASDVIVKYECPN